MPQFGAPQSGQLQAMLSAFVQNKQRNDLSLLNLAKKKQDESSIAAIANAYRTKLSSASEDELPSIMGQSLQALSPYSDNPATQYVAKGLEAELQARKAQTQREKENKLINILRSGKEEPLPQVMGALMSAKRPLNENEILSEVEQSGLVGAKEIADIELQKAKIREQQQRLLQDKSVSPFEEYKRLYGDRALEQYNADQMKIYGAKQDRVDERQTKSIEATGKRQDKSIESAEQRQQRQIALQAEEADKGRISGLRDDNAKFKNDLLKWQMLEKSGSDEEKSQAQSAIQQLTKQITDNDEVIKTTVKKYKNWKQPEQWEEKSSTSSGGNNTSGQFTVKDIRAKYSQAVQGKTDQQIIDAYKKMGITILP